MMKNYCDFIHWAVLSNQERKKGKKKKLKSRFQKNIAISKNIAYYTILLNNFIWNKLEI